MCLFIIISNFSIIIEFNMNLQNSTELTKNPSNGPVLHSYFLSSVGYWLYNYLHNCHILEPLLYCKC